MNDLNSGISHELSKPWNPYNAILPSMGLYHYTGSLTTPPCTEGVQWFVLSTPVGITADELSLLRYVVANHPGSLIDAAGDDNRPVQPLNGRTVTKSFSGKGKGDEKKGPKVPTSGKDAGATAKGTPALKTPPSGKGKE